MADAARLDLDQHFMRVGTWLRNVFDAKWRFELAKYGCFHYDRFNDMGMRDSGFSRKGWKLLRL
jgi:hypothetical protein